MVERLLGSLCMVGAILAAGAGFSPATYVHAAGKTRTVHQEGFSITFPTTWKYVASIKLANLFTGAALQKLPGDAAGMQTADGNAAVVVVVVRGTANAATIKAEETAMFNDSRAKPTERISYSTVKQHGSTFALATATITIQSQTIKALIAAATHGGKTYYFLANAPGDSSAASKTELSQLMTILDSIAVS
jgi:VCBS repeat-containing protein